MVPMTDGPFVNLSSLIDDAKCFDLVRQHRWPDGVRCPTCGSAAVARHGRDDTQPNRQRYRCKGCEVRFDDLTDTIWSFEFWRTWLTVSEGPPDLADWIRTTERSDLAGRLGHQTDRRRSGGRCTPVFRR